MRSAGFVPDGVLACEDEAESPAAGIGGTAKAGVELPEGVAGVCSSGKNVPVVLLAFPFADAGIFFAGDEDLDFLCVTNRMTT
jgi:hypothetical protein